MSRYRGPTLLSADHNTDRFDCGDETLDSWLKRIARRNQREGSSRTWVVTDGARVVAYYASSAAVVTRAEATGRVGRNQPDPLPAMLLGRLAVDREHQGRGLAAALLKHFLLKVLEVAEHTGVPRRAGARRQRHRRRLLPSLRLRTVTDRRPHPHAPRQGHRHLRSPAGGAAPFTMGNHRGQRGGGDVCSPNDPISPDTTAGSGPRLGAADEPPTACRASSCDDLRGCPT